MVIVQAPPGSSLAYTTALPQTRAAIIAQNPDIDGAVFDHRVQLQRAALPTPA